MKSKLFQYCVVWHPIKEEEKSKIIIQPTIILAGDQQAASLAAAMAIPPEYRDDLDQIEVVVRPF